MAQGSSADRYSSRTRWVVVAGFSILAVIAGFLFSLFAGYAFLEGSCGGDGGSPYAARDSSQGKLCEYDNLLFLVPFVLAPIALVALSLRAAYRWASNSGPFELAFGWLVLVPIVQIGSGLSIGLPSDRCAAVDEARYQAWRQEAERIHAENDALAPTPEAVDPTQIQDVPPPPAECGHY